MKTRFTESGTQLQATREFKEWMLKRNLEYVDPIGGRVFIVEEQEDPWILVKWEERYDGLDNETFWRAARVWAGVVERMNPAYWKYYVEQKRVTRR